MFGGTVGEEKEDMEEDDYAMVPYYRIVINNKLIFVFQLLLV